MRTAATSVSTPHWMTSAARVGYAAKGATYMAVGTLSVAAALGAGGEVSSSTSALEYIAGSTGGPLIAGLLVFGLAAYALWRFVQAFLSPEDDGLGKRAFAFGSGVIHTSLVISGLSMVFSGLGGGGSGGSGAQTFTARLLAWENGVYVVGFAGLIVIGVALKQFYKAATGDAMDDLQLSELSHRAERTLSLVTAMGLSARGVVFSIIGYFFLRAAFAHSSGQARGTGQALSWLQDQPYGPILLGVVAAGLFMYGLYAIAKSRYRKGLGEGALVSVTS